MMAHTCAYRAAGNDAAARAAYEEFRRQHNTATSPAVSVFPEWSKLDDARKYQWRDIFRAGHKAYRDVIIEENRSDQNGH